jgi:phosphatidylglycerol:prolipoprotein diacylglycerol transferase
MLMCALLAACLVAHSRVARIGVDPDRMVTVYLLAAIGGLLGARLLHFAMAEPTEFFGNPLVFFDPGRGGFAFYGGVLFAGGTVAAYARWKGMPVWKLADVIAPCIMLGLAVGRVGCFFAGCCHGAVCSVGTVRTLVSLSGGSVVWVDGFPWIALVFRSGVGVGSIHQTPVYPSQVWEALAGFLLFALLSWVWKHARRFDGQVMALLLLTYPVVRSTLEGFRGDAVRGTEWLGFLSTSQLVSIPVLLVGVGVILVRWRVGVVPEEEFRYEDELDPDGEWSSSDSGQGEDEPTEEVRLFQDVQALEELVEATEPREDETLETQRPLGVKDA